MILNGIIANRNVEFLVSQSDGLVSNHDHSMTTKRPNFLNFKLNVEYASI